jgi:hypothetical protein
MDSINPGIQTRIWLDPDLFGLIRILTKLWQFAVRSLLLAFQFESELQMMLHGLDATDTHNALSTQDYL